MTTISQPITHFLQTVKLDSLYNSTSNRTPLKQYIGAPVREIVLTVTLGTLAGGTSPAWIASAADAIFSKIALQIDGGVTLKSGSYLSFKTKYKMRNFGNALPVGTHVISFTRTPDFTVSGNSRQIYQYLLPADILGQIDLLLDIPALTALTTGTPTSSSGTQVNISTTEERNANIRALESTFQPLYETEYIPSSLGTSAEVPFDLPRGYVYTNVLTEAYDGTTLSDTLITKHRLVRDNDTDLVNTTWLDMEQFNIREFNGSTALGTGLAFYEAMPAFDATVETGNKLTVKHTYGTATTSNSTKVFLEYTVPMSAASIQAIKQHAAKVGSTQSGTAK